MPSSITHELIAEEILKRLPKEAQDAVASAPDEYFLGAQGPDMFFFYRIGSRKEYNLGKFMHRNRVFDTFSAFLAALSPNNELSLNEEERKQALSYALGFVTHYSADSTFHPFVYRYLEETRAKKITHQQMENDWDVYFLRTYRKQESESYPFAFSIKKIKQNGTAAKLMNFVALRLERDRVKRRKYNAGLKNFSRYLKFFHKKCYRRSRRWEKAEKILHIKKYLSALYPRETPDPAFLNGEYFWEYSNHRGNSADELFSRAVNEGARLAVLFLQAIEGKPLEKEDFGRGLLTGEIL